MFKKFILILFISIFLAGANTFAQDEFDKPVVQPLKTEQNHTKYKYGSLEKTFRNPADKNFNGNEFSSDSTRKVFTVLDVLNIFIFFALTVLLILTLYLKSKKITLKDFILGTKKHQKNKFTILSVKQLDNGKTVYLLEVNSKQIIAGTTNSKIDIIVPLDKTYSEEDVPQEYIENLFSNNTEEFKNLEE